MSLHNTTHCAACYPIGRPSHHSITPNKLLNPKCCAAFCPTNCSTQHGLQQVKRVVLYRIFCWALSWEVCWAICWLRNMPPNTTYCSLCGSTKHTTQHTAQRIILHNIAASQHAAQISGQNNIMPNLPADTIFYPSCNITCRTCYTANCRQICFPKCGQQNMVSIMPPNKPFARQSMLAS